MRSIVIFFLFLIGSGLCAQDKLIFKDGRAVKCKILAINPATVTYKDSTTAEKMITVSKLELILAEFKSGSVHIFGAESPTVTQAPSKNLIYDAKEARREKERSFKNNIIGVQIPDIAFGRLTLTYERLLLDKSLGVMIPLSMTYDPRVLSMGLTGDSSAAASTANPIRRNISFVTGLDLNYYVETRSYSKFFFGPRIRYGTDVYMFNTTAYSVQFQNGLLLCDSKGKMASSIALGFGFVRVLSIPLTGGIDPKQSYPWMSLTIRIGFRA
jgi:hypothetical protein